LGEPGVKARLHTTRQNKGILNQLAMDTVYTLLAVDALMAQLHNVNVSLPSSQVQWGDSICICSHSTASKLLHKNMHNIKMAVLAGIVQRNSTITVFGICDTAWLGC